MLSLGWGAIQGFGPPGGPALLRIVRGVEGKAKLNRAGLPTLLTQRHALTVAPPSDEGIGENPMHAESRVTGRRRSKTGADSSMRAKKTWRGKLSPQTRTIDQGGLSKTGTTNGRWTPGGSRPAQKKH